MDANINPLIHVPSAKMCYREDDLSANRYGDEYLALRPGTRGGNVTDELKVPEPGKKV
jgi:hypothetical protein